MGKKRRSTEEIVEELRLFHHKEAANRLEWLQNRVNELEKAGITAKEES